MSPSLFLGLMFAAATFNAACAGQAARHRHYRWAVFLSVWSAAIIVVGLHWAVAGIPFAVAGK